MAAVKPQSLANKETALATTSGPFDLTAMEMMAAKLPALQEFMNKNLKQGVKADWEYAHIIWKRTLKKDEEPKAALLDPGVAKITNFVQMRPRHRIIEKEIDTKTNNLRYVVAVEIVPYIPIMYHNPVTNQMEPYYPIVAEGIGSATTREKRYRVTFEYFKERDLRAQGWTEEEFTKFTAENTADFVKGEAPTRLFYLPTAESLGADNTLLKMAAKRAEMDAVFQLPGVAGRFSQEIDLKEDRGEEKPTQPTPTPQPEPPKKVEVDAKVKEEPAPAFQSAAELPKVPDDFRPCEEAGYAIDFIVENFDQQPETIRALVYKAMTAVEPHLTDVEAVKAVREEFEERRKPAEPTGGSESDVVYNALQEAALDGEMIVVIEPGKLMTRFKIGSDTKREFLGDRFFDYSTALRKIGYEWVKAGQDSHWKKEGG